MSDKNRSDAEEARFKLLVQFGYDASIDVSDDAYAYTVYGNRMIRTYATLDQLEEGIIEAANEYQRLGFEAGKALRNWQEGFYENYGYKQGVNG